MPNAFQFIDKKTNEAEKFSVIDDKLRLFLGKEPDDKKYYRGWYDAFGSCAAMGQSFAEMKADSVKHNDDAEVLRMLDWFDENYRPTAWYESRAL